MRFKKDDEVVFDYKNTRIIGTIVGVSPKNKEYVIHHYMYGMIIGVPEVDVIRSADPFYPAHMVNDDDFMEEMRNILDGYCSHEWEQSAGWFSGPVEFQCKKCRVDK